MLLTFEVVWKGEGFYFWLSITEQLTCTKQSTLFSLFTTMHNMLDECCHDTGFQTSIRYVEEYWLSILATAKVLSIGEGSPSTPALWWGRGRSALRVCALAAAHVEYLIYQYYGKATLNRFQFSTLIFNWYFWQNNYFWTKQQILPVLPKKALCV